MVGVQVGELPKRALQPTPRDPWHDEAALRGWTLGSSTDKESTLVATMFAIDGPRNVPVYQGRASRTITHHNVREFWADNEELAKRRGCYVFGIRAGKGLTPGYVGRATKSFKQEVFTHHKLTRYHQFLADYKKGAPILFFVMLPIKKGKANSTHIADLERFLIQTGLAANADLVNIKGTKQADWGIMGVLRSGQGKPSRAAGAFKNLMKLRAG